MDTQKRVRRKSKNWLICLLLLMGLALCLFVYIGIRQRIEAMESEITGAKLEPRQLQAALSGADTSEASLSYIKCRKHGYVDDSYVDIVNQQLSAIPAYIQDAFVRDNWAVYVTDIDIGQTYYSGKYDMVMGTTNFEEKRILIEDRIDAVYESPIHEVGHWFDLYLGLVSDTDEFKAVYQAESASFIRAYGTDCVRDEMELFAEGFWHYITDPAGLKAVSPQLYQFIHLRYYQFRIMRTWYEYSSIFA